MKGKLDLLSFDNSWFSPGKSLLVRIIWYTVNRVFINSYLFRFFGAEIATGCVVKPKVNIKYPWKLKIGFNSWLGEEVWIDNLDEVTIGNNVCISQGTFLLCGNHDYKKSSFDLIISPITVKDGAWIGAKSIICPGAIIEENVVISLGSLLKGKTEKDMIYSGNPAVPMKKRIIV